MTKHSAGILLFRRRGYALEFLLAHPGGPFWSRKDLHAWSIPKGEFDENEEAEEAARREFEEETGTLINGDLTPLPPVRTSRGKIIHAFLAEGELDTSLIKSNFFEMEWPPKSGKMQSFPEVDKAEWFASQVAFEKIHKGQKEILERALRLLILT